MLLTLLKQLHLSALKLPLRTYFLLLHRNNGIFPKWSFFPNYQVLHKANLDFCGILILFHTRFIKSGVKRNCSLNFITSDVRTQLHLNQCCVDAVSKWIHEIWGKSRLRLRLVASSQILLIGSLWPSLVSYTIDLIERPNLNILREEFIGTLLRNWGKTIIQFYI